MLKFSGNLAMTINEGARKTRGARVAMTAIHNRWAPLAVGLLLASAVQADDRLSRCLDISDESERLACFDEATRKTRDEPRADESDARDEVIERCRRDMGEFGSAMVKACVDQDLAALRSLEEYPSEHQPILERCFRDMGEFGPAMVKACADQDITAEEALRRMSAE